MITTMAANVRQKWITTTTRRSVHQTSVLNAFILACVPSITQRPVAAIGAGLPCGETSPSRPMAAIRAGVPGMW